MSTLHDLEKQKSVDDLGFNINLSKYFVARVFPYLKSVILDVGCGVGVVSELLVEKGFTVVGVDGNRNKIAVARRKMSNMQFEYSNFLTFNPKQHFSTVLIKNVLEHLSSQESLRLLRKAYDWLLPKGHCIVYVPNEGALHKRVGVAMGLGTTTWLDREVGHVQTYTAKKLQRQFDVARLITVKRGGLFLKPFPNDFMVLLNPHYCDALFTVSENPELEQWCSGIYIIGEKR